MTEAEAIEAARGKPAGSITYYDPGPWWKRLLNFLLPQRVEHARAREGEAEQDRRYGFLDGSPAYPDCRAGQGDRHPVTGSIVILTVAHLNHEPADCRDENLKAWCQRCHNTYDLPMRRAGIKRRAFEAMETGDLFA